MFARPCVLRPPFYLNLNAPMPLCPPATSWMHLPTVSAAILDPSRLSRLALQDITVQNSNSHTIRFNLFRNLIDIPSTLQVERLQQQEAQNRSNEYLNALNTVKLPEQTIRKLYSMTSVMATTGMDLQQTNEANETTTAAAPRERSSTSSGSSLKAPSVREVLAEKTVDPKTVGWVSICICTMQKEKECGGFFCWTTQHDLSDIIF